ncbi:MULTISPECIES: CoA transferase [unclassified Sutcliffiella]|jgi:crotonobetainyl-CoA:carnitine CoA-transferase CaiB-like acyl-CoA transferase|uniref:CaiB/BaiF CoA transferase family protein n=1 Tax=unclassified Sutcliffiella TaxID=2837532 RepID=UPI0030D5A9B2
MIEKLLEGIRILDFTNYLPGPYATQRLADLGAEIIKVEPLAGDPARHTGVKRDGTGVVYLANNYGKMSVSIDLKDEGDKDKIMGLLEGCDVIIESFRPGVMSRFNLDYESLKLRKPDIIYCSITGYGNNGRWSKLGSHDINYMALSGMLAQLKDTSGRPIHPSITIADYFGSMAACEIVLALLLKKERSGIGGYHSISLTDVAASYMGTHLSIHQEVGEEHGITLLNGDIISYGIYETRDGRFMALGALEQKFWQNFCEAVDREEWLGAHFSDRRYSNPVSHGMEELFAGRTFEEWITFSQVVDCCMTPVLEVGELSSYPYFKENNSIFLDDAGNLNVAMHTGGSKKLKNAPAVGEHTAIWLDEL